MRLHRIAVHVSSLGLFLARASAFTRNAFPFSRRCFSSSSHRLAASESDATLPTIEQVVTDPFMAQLSHAGQICALLLSDGKANTLASDLHGKANTLASDLLPAQLSHEDGIRAFFATYLTGEGDDTAADREEIPEPLAGAMHKADMNLLVPLACVSTRASYVACG